MPALQAIDAAAARRSPSSPAISTFAHSRHRFTPGRGFDHVDDECAADARRGLEEMPVAVGAADELGVRHALAQPEGVEQPAHSSRAGRGTAASASGSVRVTKMPPSCATAIGGVA